MGFGWFEPTYHLGGSRKAWRTSFAQAGLLACLPVGLPASLPAGLPALAFSIVRRSLVYYLLQFETLFRRSAAQCSALSWHDATTRYPILLLASG